MNTPTKVEYQFSCTTEPEITFDNLVAGIFTLNLSQSIGAVQTLTVAFEEADSDQLPAFSVKFEGPGHIFGNLSYPQLNAVKTLVRTLEGLLALQTDIRHLKHIRVKAGDMEMVLGPAMGAVQSARPSQAFVEEMVRLSSLVTEHEVPLSFWRLGMAANSAGAGLRPSIISGSLWNACSAKANGVKRS